MHVETLLAVAVILLTFAAHMLLTPQRSAAVPPESEAARAMRERVESLAAAVRRGEISVQEWHQQMAAFRPADKSS